MAGTGFAREGTGLHARLKFLKTQTRRHHRQEEVDAPFRSNEPMQGPPSRTAEDFKQPLLRKCTFSLDTVEWGSAEWLGDGYNGSVWKVAFGNSGPFALKVFWELQPPDFGGSFAPQREAQNAAILQMVEAVLEEEPVHLPFESPDTHKKAMDNMLAFSMPQKNAKPRPATESSCAVLSSYPPLTKCYGWLAFDGKFFQRMPPSMRPRVRKEDKPPHSMSYGNIYHAIVYEYIPKEDNKPESIEAVVQFFHLIGFSLTDSKIENWHGSKLIDMSDIVHPGGYGWTLQKYNEMPYATALIELSQELKEQKGGKQ
ncbi:hypothetical protein F4823DRAFT_621036 [Ustulina deusta]|nr:hypothetical protein F4823DRAFT_621036 [Ustulina deusta]